MNIVILYMHTINQIAESEKAEKPLVLYVNNYFTRLLRNTFTNLQFLQKYIFLLPGFVHFYLFTF